MAAPYRIEFQHRDRYLRAHVVGPEDSMEVSLAYWTEIAAECALNAVKRLLVVEDLGTAATAGDMREMVGVLAEIGFRDICIAYVDTLDPDTVIATAEMHARQLGLSGAIFRDESDAIAWLDGCEPPARGDHP